MLVYLRDGDPSLSRVRDARLVLTEMVRALPARYEIERANIISDIVAMLRGLPLVSGTNCPASEPLVKGGQLLAAKNTFKRSAVKRQ